MLGLNRIFSITTIIVFLAFSLSSKGQSPYQFQKIDISNGLSHNQVTSILKDSKGFMWFGTMAGLNRYDGYRFKVYRHNQLDVRSLNDDYIVNLAEGPFNKLWVQTRTGFNIYDPARETFDRDPTKFLDSVNIQGELTEIIKGNKRIFWITTTNGLYKYDQYKKRTDFIRQQLKNYAPITSVVQSNSGSVWIIHNNGVLEEIDAANNKHLYSTQLPFNDRVTYKLFIDQQNHVWIYSTDSPKGVFYLDTETKLLERYYKDGGRIRLSTNIVNSIVQDNKGLIWIGTDHGGINILDKRKSLIKVLLSKEDDEKSLAQNSTTAIYKDNADIIWIGTFKKGISYYHDSFVKFPLYKHFASDPNSLKYDDVNRFVEDNKGNLWIGTNGGGLLYFDRQKNTYIQYRHSAVNNNSLSNDVIVSLYLDKDQKLWIGTYFGGLDCFDGKNFTHFRQSSVAGSLSDDRVWEILEDSQRRLWVGTLAGGLNLYDRQSGKFSHFKKGEANSVQSNYIAAILEDKEGNLWFGTDNGIDILEKTTGKFLHFSHVDQDTSSLSNNNVISLLQDHDGIIWVGTRDGLNIFDQKTRSFKNLKTLNGLPDNTILTLLEDDKRNIWVSTPNGLSNITKVYSKGVQKLKFQNYDQTDGLQGRIFNENAALKTKKGELIFGGANGFNIINPNTIKKNTTVPPVVLTDFQLFNESLRVGTQIDGRVVLENALPETREIVLNHDQNIFSIEFAALNYLNPEKNKYAYVLEGFNDKWLTADGSRRVTYTNLDPGDYIFRVKASNNSDIWNEGGSVLHIKILPPFWKTTTAYIFYVVAFFTILFLVRQRGIRKLKEEFAIEQERKEAQQMHELDLMKIKFFTNVSHEFRTPLSLILTPLEKLVEQADNEGQKSHLQLIQRNARRLLNLVNQLLDFRKMEVQELKLNLSKGDIIQSVHDHFLSFTDIAEKKNIVFEYHSNAQSFVTLFDQDKLERIIFNLCSNAFKFTPEHGRITFGVNLAVEENRATPKAELTIEITDTGIGIPAEKKAKIFERFFQNDTPGSIVNQGSGIGLAITKEFLNLYGGGIELESEIDKGSCFRVWIPLQVIEQEAPLVVDGLEISADGISDRKEDVMSGIGNARKATLLLVEDNEDFRFYLKDNLKQSFNIVEASNGRSGWAKTLSAHPDLIVSDISMPEMNGIEFCIKVRQDSRTSHIPVILLTALTGEDHQLKGLETGANDYLTKPFNFEILLSKIKNLLKQKESMKKTYQKQVEATPSEVIVESADIKFVQQALQVVEANITNFNFSVEELSREMCMSRVALYKKILALTGKTPIEFIRSIRLRRASQLLIKSNLSIAEVAYESGFNNPKYFAKYFKAEFGVLPSAYTGSNNEESIVNKE